MTPGVGQLPQVRHARRRRVGEGEVGAALLGRDGAVGDGEVAHRQLLDLDLVPGDGRGLAQPGPAGRGQRRVGQVDDLAVGRVGGQRHRVRVGDRSRSRPSAVAGCQAVDQEAVVLARSRSPAAGPPDAGARRRGSSPTTSAGAVGVVEELQGHLLRGRRPDREGRASAREGRRRAAPRSPSRRRRRARPGSARRSPRAACPAASRSTATTWPRSAVGTLPRSAGRR